MIVKFLTIIGFLSFSTHAAHFGHYDYYDEPTHYSYGYRVNDPHTGDEKMHHETKFGDVVKGFYRLKEADGTFREVHYTADKHNGFQAHVKKIGLPIPVLYHLFKR